MPPKRRIDPLALAFAGAAERYERGRPEYPAEPIEWAYGELGLDGQATVLDLAAGTGKLSRVLARQPGGLVAVEPLAEMRSVLQQKVPGIDVRDGTAEHLPLETGVLDAVFVAEAFHWFDQQHALPEIHRVLRPGGTLVLIFGRTDWEELPWNEAVIERLNQVSQEHVTPENRPWTGLWREPLERSHLFTPLETHVFQNVLDFSVEKMVLLTSTWSYVAALSDADRAALLTDVEAILREHGADRFELHGTITVHLARSA